MMYSSIKSLRFSTAGGGGDATLRYIIPELVLIVGPNTDFNVDMRVGRQTCELTVF